jgi:hypothetical protein
MKYEKPEVVVLTTATAAIQAGQKISVFHPDGQKVPTQPAYEADE